MTEEKKPADGRPEENGREEEMRQDENVNKQPETAADGGVPAEPAAATPASRTAPGGTGAVLPTKAAEDDARSWGDREEDHDAWLKEQKPPHWG